MILDLFSLRDSSMSKSPKTPKPPSKTIGWREWLALPDLGVEAVKAKIDTGARTSSLHALHLKPFERDGKTWIRFEVHPLQRNSKLSIHAEAEVIEFREVRSSNGHTTRRPVILTNILWDGELWPVELTLASRDEMGFRMLLGREAVRGRYSVDAGNSWYGGRPPAVIRKRGPRRKPQDVPQTETSTDSPTADTTSPPLPETNDRPDE